MIRKLGRLRLRGWYRLGDARAMSEANYPGVYVLGHFKRLPKTVNPVSRQVFYIGETCGQTLIKRWRQFNQSAFRNRAAHSGGSTYYKQFGVRRQKDVAVAFYVPDHEKPLATQVIRYVERRWLLRYFFKNRASPLCNRK